MNKFKLLILFLFLAQLNLFAEVIHLKNNDRITGAIIAESNSSLTVKSKILGKIILDKSQIEKITKLDKEKIKQKAKKPEEKIKWKRKISAGFTQVNGNTETSEFYADLLINRKTDLDEFTIKGDVYYSSSDDKMDSQQWYSLVRYAHSFGKLKKWYYFYRLEADHDRFAGIDYRLTPASGIGYWFFDKEKFKFMAESGLGYEYTSFRNGTSEGEAILSLRTYFEKEILTKLNFSQDINLYPSLEDFGQYRLRSETSLIHPLKENLSLKVSFIADYDSDPVASAKETDTRLISALEYSF